jgi:hypothetical protein
VTTERGLEPTGMRGLEPRFPGAREGNPRLPGAHRVVPKTKGDCPFLISLTTPNPRGPQPSKGYSCPPVLGCPPLK